MSRASLLPLALPLISALLVGCGASPVEAPTNEAPSAEAQPVADAPPVATAPAPPPAFDVNNPDSCAPCHAAVVDEWRESMHARAHHSRDPIYAAMRALRIDKEGAPIAERCATCHNPADTVDHESDRAKTGVACATCHQLSAEAPVAGQRGAQALVATADGVLRGARDLPAGASPVHGTGPAHPALADGKTVCLACHAEERNKAGLPTCSTGPETAASGGEQRCVSCHMAETDGPSGAASTQKTHRSHHFAGPHRMWYQDDHHQLEAAMGVSGRFDGDQLVVTLTNHTGHAFPSGFPGRMVVILLKGFDATGKEVWRNAKNDPIQEHPDLVLNQVYHDANGAPTLPPYGVTIARDTRLKPGEARDVAVALPPGIVRVDAKVRFLLIAPAAAAALDLGKRIEARPGTTHTTSFTR